MRRWGVVPTNFSIKQSENGHEVYTPKNELLGTAPTLEDARQFVPDRGHELLVEVLGVRLPTEMPRAVLTAGFPAWVEGEDAGGTGATAEA